MTTICSFAFARKSLAVAVATLASAGVLAQPVILEEIIVTAQKRAESLQDVSVSVNAMSGEKIGEAGINKIEDIQAYVPNLTMSETGIGTNIYMRGLGSGINQGFEQSVGMYVDGVHYGRAQLSRAPFLDLARVEVLRGPQNILYGKNSVAGAISIVTAPPEDEYGADLSVLYEPEYGETVVDLVVNGSLSDNLSARLAYRARDLDGYIDNIDGGQEPGRDEDTARLTLRWDINADLDATLKLGQGTFDVTGRQIEILGDAPSLNPALGGANWGQFLLALNPLNSLTGADQTPTSVLNSSIDYARSSNGDYSQNETGEAVLNVNYRWNDYEFTSTTGMLEYEYEELCDCDFTSANIFFVQSNEKYEQFSQEFRIASPIGETVEWLAGVYFHSSELDFQDRFFTPDSVVGNVLDTILPAAFQSGSSTAYPAGAAQQIVDISVPREFEQDTSLTSAFIQATINVTDTARLTLGGRYSDESKDGRRYLTVVDAAGNEIPYDDSLVPGGSMGIDYLLGRILQVSRHDLSGERDESNFAPSVTFEMDLTDDTLAYANWSRGYKSGGYDTRSNVPPVVTTVTNPFSSALSFSLPAGSFEYDSEESRTIELGLKNRLAGGAVELNIAAFRTKYSDLQVSIYDGVLGFNVGNAAEAEAQGIELDGRWAATDNLTLSGALAWLDFEFQDYPNGQCTQLQRIVGGVPTCDYEGLTNQYVADFSGSLTADYTREVGDSLLLRTSLDLVFTTDYNPSQNLDPLMEQDGYQKLNLRIALADEEAGWEIALLGKNLTDEKVITYANDTPLAANLTQSVGHYTFLESPRTIAVQGSFSF